LDMIDHRRQIRSAAWTWAIGWFMATVGLVISDVYSTPNRGLIAAYLLGLLGWAVGGAGTIRYVRRRFGGDGYVVALSAAGWGVGALLAVVLGLVWQDEWSPGFWGPILGAAIGGSIGGALTIPSRSLSSHPGVLRSSLSGAIRWGAAFLAFQVLAFYAGRMESASIRARSGHPRRRRRSRRAGVPLSERRERAPPQEVVAEALLQGSKAPRLQAC
jgi:hypothetical protein